MSTNIRKYAGFFFLFIGILALVWLGTDSQSDQDVVRVTTSVQTMANTVSTTEEPSVFYVDIKGEVLYPGVYAVGTKMRIADAINLAGGLTEQSDVSEINLSKNVYDQMVINIPKTAVETSGSVDEDSLRIFHIDIKGAVSNPGVYKVEEGTRVYEAIAIAGGFLENADSSNLNLSQEVVDEMVIQVAENSNPIIPELVEFKAYIGGEVLCPSEYYVTERTTLQELITKAGGLTSSADTTNLFMQMTLFEGFRLVVPSVSEDDPVEATSGLVNLNTATLDELTTLNGIGLILGQRIIDYRAENGPFESIEDVMLVSGIKESVYEDIKDDIEV